MNAYHHSVMSKEILSYINLKDEGLYVDATLGGGGHTKKLLENNETIRVYSFDKDKDSINYNKKLEEQYTNRLKMFNDNFINFRSRLALQRITKIDGIIFDLGVSGYQLSTAARGLSFDLEGNLDMRMNQEDELTAEVIINEYSLAKLTEIIRNFGEEREAFKIAKGIIRNRQYSPIKTTWQLAEIIDKNTISPFKIKARARVFQALRIYLNAELETLKSALYDAVEMMNTGGRIIVLSYHSLEDRIVKHLFIEESKDCICPTKFPKCICDKRAKIKIITKKPLTPTALEVTENRSSKSAKMRVAEGV